MKIPRTLALAFCAVSVLAVSSAWAAREKPQPADDDGGDDSSAPAATSASDSGKWENSVVKVFSTVRRPDYLRPWEKEAPKDISGSGVVIEGRRILTNAHVVLYASQVQIQGNQSGDKVSATVESVAPGIDLAVLKLDDESFFDSHAAVPRAAALPRVKDSVLVYGYPTGGTSLSITKGIVSRIEFVPYNIPVSGLRVQIDAAINAGNSGGPAISGDKMIGIAFSRQVANRAQNIGYIIPCEEIEYFLKQVGHGGTYRKPSLRDEAQTLENPALRTYLKIEPTVRGMVVTRPYSSDAGYPLQPWDIITKIGDVPIDDQGMVHLPGKPRLSFNYLVQSLAKNGTVPLTIVRHDRTLSIAMPVMNDLPLVIPYRQGEYPSYFIFGPIAFSSVGGELSGGLARNPGATFALSFLGSPLILRNGDKPAFPGEELVIVPSPFFPHKLSRGYGNPIGRIVKSINGVPVKNLKHLVALIRDCRDTYITIEFMGRGVETLVFPRTEALAATDEILNDNSVRSQGSADMMAVWNAKPHT